MMKNPLQPHAPLDSTASQRDVESSSADHQQPHPATLQQTALTASSSTTTLPSTFCAQRPLTLMFEHTDEESTFVATFLCPQEDLKLTAVGNCLMGLLFFVVSLIGTEDNTGVDIKNFYGVAEVWNRIYSTIAVVNTTMGLIEVVIIVWGWWVRRKRMRMGCEEEEENRTALDDETFPEHVPPIFLEFCRWMVLFGNLALPHLVGEVRQRGFCSNDGKVNLMFKSQLENGTKCNMNFFDGFFVSVFASTFFCPPRFVFIVPTVIATSCGFFLTRPLEDRPGIDLSLDAMWVTCFVLLLCVAAANEKFLRNQYKLRRLTEIEGDRVMKTKYILQSLLLNMLPASAMAKLLAGQPICDTKDCVPVLFSDIVDFSKWCNARSAAEVTSMLNNLYSRFDSDLFLFGVDKVKTIGDAYWCTSGFPDDRMPELLMLVGGQEEKSGQQPPRFYPACRLAAFAISMQSHVEQLKTDVYHKATNDTFLNSITGLSSLRMRIGMHCGPVIGSVVGRKAATYDVFGETNLVAQALEQASIGGSILVSQDLCALLEEELGGEEGIKKYMAYETKLVQLVTADEAAVAQATRSEDETATHDDDDDAKILEMLERQLDAEEARRNIEGQHMVPEVIVVDVPFTSPDQKGDRKTATSTTTLKAKYLHRFSWHPLHAFTANKHNHLHRDSATSIAEDQQGHHIITAEKERELRDALSKFLSLNGNGDQQHQSGRHGAGHHDNSKNNGGGVLVSPATELRQQFPPLVPSSEGAGTNISDTESIISSLVLLQPAPIPPPLPAVHASDTHHRRESAATDATTATTTSETVSSEGNLHQHGDNDTQHAAPPVVASTATAVVVQRHQGLSTMGGSGSGNTSIQTPMHISAATPLPLLAFSSSMATPAAASAANTRLRFAAVASSSATPRSSSSTSSSHNNNNTRSLSAMTQHPTAGTTPHAGNNAIRIDEGNNDNDVVAKEDVADEGRYKTKFLSRCFTNDEDEIAYKKMMREEHFARHSRSVFTALSCFVLLLVIISATDTSSTQPALFYVVLVAVCGTFALCALFPTKVANKFYVGFVVFYLGYLVLLGTMTSDPVKADRTTAEMFYLLMFFALLSPTLGSAGLPSAVILLFNVFLLLVPFFAIRHHLNPEATNHQGFLLVALFVSAGVWGVAIPSSDFRAREAFYDRLCFADALAQVKRDHCHVVTLVGNLVPKFVAHRIANYVVNPQMNPVANSIDCAGVMFIRLNSQTTLHNASTQQTTTQDKDAPLLYLKAITHFVVQVEELLDLAPTCLTKIKLVGDVMLVVSGLQSALAAAAEDGVQHDEDQESAAAQGLEIIESVFYEKQHKDDDDDIDDEDDGENDGHGQHSDENGERGPTTTSAVVTEAGSAFIESSMSSSVANSSVSMSTSATGGGGGGGQSSTSPATINEISSTSTTPTASYGRRSDASDPHNTKNTKNRQVVHRRRAMRKAIRRLDRYQRKRQEKGHFVDAQHCPGTCCDQSSSFPQSVHLHVLAAVALLIGDELSTATTQSTQSTVTIGLHSGALFAGAIGTDRLLYDVFGDTVNTASRVMSSATSFPSAPIRRTTSDTHSSSNVVSSGGSVLASEFFVDDLQTVVDGKWRSREATDTSEHDGSFKSDLLQAPGLIVHGGEQSNSATINSGAGNDELDDGSTKLLFSLLNDRHDQPLDLLESGGLSSGTPNTAKKETATTPSSVLPPAASSTTATCSVAQHGATKTSFMKGIGPVEVVHLVMLL